ncbi:MAG TPA: helix-hairpin-helix domain-containing protein, partial [Candidatus Limnocylindrales bacterium]|nr:helix-hairpin-helix domain-containing protein [Candidatus Limnocylindrales bacterium]
NIGDLYFLHAAELEKLPRMAEKSAVKLIGAIEKSKGNPLRRLLFGLGIRFVGERAASLLAEHFGCMDRLQSAGAEELTHIPEIGPKIAESLVLFFSLKSTGDVLSKLRQAGVNFTEPLETSAGNTLAGKSFVFSGSLSGYTRDEAFALVEARGGKVSGTVSKKTDYLVVGEEPGSKLTKAQAIGVAVLDEAAFKQLLQ